MIKVYESFQDRKVCIMGLGYVGLTLATVMAEAGFQVTGVEIKEDILEKLAAKKPHFFEPGLEERLQAVIDKKRLLFSRNIPPGFGGTVYIITVGTPLDEHKKVRLDMIKNVSKEIAGFLKPGDLVVGRSTVKLGTTEEVIAPELDRAGVDYDLAFCPERTLEGRALEELSFLPQVVGARSYRTAMRASQVFQFITPTVIRVSNIRTAEMIKLIDNAHRDVIFAYSNEVARMCDAVGISAAEVINSGKLGYPRTNLPLPGPVGGPCLSKDSHILAEGLLQRGLKPEMTLAARSINERQPAETAAFIRGYATALDGFPTAPVIALLGLAFKGRPSTDDLRGTMAEPVFAALKNNFPRALFRGYDAVVTAENIRTFGLEPCPELPAAFGGANLVLILNNHPVFSALPLNRLAATMNGPGLIYDFWNHYTASELDLPPEIRYIALGGHHCWSGAEYTD